jgi:hypothetical protein
MMGLERGSWELGARLEIFILSVLTDSRSELMVDTGHRRSGRISTIGFRR